jgi:hypothetical protein
VAIDMTVTATGEPRAVAPGESLPFACRGSFIRRPVVLQGRFGVRTGTRAFGTIRRVRLTGVMTYDTGGPVECGSLGGSCDSETGLSASHGLASLIADPSKRTLVLSFPELNGWYHVMALSQLSVASAQLPTIRIGMPANVPVTGALTFSARETSELVEDGCPVVTATGDLAGRLRVRFTGWATRTFAASSATYRRTGPP